MLTGLECLLARSTTSRTARHATAPYTRVGSGASGVPYVVPQMGSAANAKWAARHSLAGVGVLDERTGHGRS